MFTVIYRVGGTERCEWRKVLPVATYDEARTIQEETERMGYKALIHRTAMLDKLGMPEGWEA